MHAELYEDGGFSYEDESTINTIRLTATPINPRAALINISSGEDAHPDLGIMSLLDTLE